MVCDLVGAQQTKQMALELKSHLGKMVGRSFQAEWLTFVVRSARIAQVAAGKRTWFVQTARVNLCRRPRRQKAPNSDSSDA
jgi:hypothetical protein